MAVQTVWCAIYMFITGRFFFVFAQETIKSFSGKETKHPNLMMSNIL